MKKLNHTVRTSHFLLDAMNHVNINFLVVINKIFHCVCECTQRSVFFLSFFNIKFQIGKFCSRKGNQNNTIITQTVICVSFAKCAQLETIEKTALKPVGKVDWRTTLIDLKGVRSACLVVGLKSTTLTLFFFVIHESAQWKIFGVRSVHNNHLAWDCDILIQGGISSTIMEKAHLARLFFLLFCPKVSCPVRIKFLIIRHAEEGTLCNLPNRDLLQISLIGSHITA